MIATSATCPSFNHKMRILLPMLHQLKPYLHIVFVYISEQHAIDKWPIGYTIKEATTKKQRWDNLQHLLDVNPQLSRILNTSLIDSPETNAFNNETGSWPEAYMFVSKNGDIQWMSQVEETGTVSLDEAKRYAQYQGYIKNKEMKAVKKVTVGCINMWSCFTANKNN